MAYVRVHPLKEFRRILSRLPQVQWDPSQPFRYKADVSGSCESPGVFEIMGMDRDGYEEIAKPGAKTRCLELTVRCRKCERCMRYRRIVWGERALCEWKIAPRTWLCTFTFDESDHWKYKIAAIGTLRKKSVNFYDLSEDDRFTAIAREHAEELTMFFKRCRKGLAERGMDGELKVPPLSFRYMLVTEAHESGEPHFHALIHEITGAGPVLKRHLESHWRKGFTNFKLVENERLALYSAKYLGKDRRARVRASRFYGNGYNGLLAIAE